MSDFSAEKRMIQAFYGELDQAEGDNLGAILARYYAPNHLWRGFHPFDEQYGAEAVAERFWRPLRQALRHIQRREDIFMAGANEMDGFQSTWV
uniref:hypothetical protein n=1 Tax=Novosphingobium huizhouense TaxID=2866625 RepID=UPI001CD8BD22